MSQVNKLKTFRLNSKKTMFQVASKGKKKQNYKSTWMVPGIALELKQLLLGPNHSKAAGVLFSVMILCLPPSTTPSSPVPTSNHSLRSQDLGHRSQDMAPPHPGHGSFYLSRSALALEFTNLNYLSYYDIFDRKGSCVAASWFSDILGTAAGSFHKLFSVPGMIFLHYLHF